MTSHHDGDGPSRRKVLECMTWAGTGVHGPEAFPATPFLERLADYGAPHGVLELERV